MTKVVRQSTDARLLWEVVSRRGARAQVEAVQGAGGWLLETGVFRPFWHGRGTANGHPRMSVRVDLNVSVVLTPLLYG